MKDSDFITDDRITFVDTPGSVSDAPISGVRPGTNDRVEIEIPIGAADLPHFILDLDGLGEDGGALPILGIEIPGNVKTVNLYMKSSSASAQWDYVDLNVPVAADGSVIPPAQWPREQDNMVDVGVLKIELVEPRRETDELYNLKIDLIGCAPCISSEYYEQRF